MSTSKGRNELVVKLISIADRVGDAPIKVRFCGAVQEFEQAAEGVDKTFKGRRIVDMFLLDRGMFTIQTFSPRVIKMMSSYDLAGLIEAKSNIMVELARMEAVMDVVRAPAS